MGRRWFWTISSKVALNRFLPTVSLRDCLRGIDDWKVTVFEKCETHIMRTFFPLGLNEKEEYLITQKIRFLHLFIPTSEFFILKIILTAFFDNSFF